MESPVLYLGCRKLWPFNGPIFRCKNSIISTDFNAGSQLIRLWISCIHGPVMPPKSTVALRSCSRNSLYVYSVYQSHALARAARSRSDVFMIGLAFRHWRGQTPCPLKRKGLRPSHVHQTASSPWPLHVRWCSGKSSCRDWTRIDECG